MFLVDKVAAFVLNDWLRNRGSPIQIIGKNGFSENGIKLGWKKKTTGNNSYLSKCFSGKVQGEYMEFWWFFYFIFSLWPATVSSGMIYSRRWIDLRWLTFKSAFFQFAMQEKNDHELSFFYKVYHWNIIHANNIISQISQLVSWQVKKTGVRRTPGRFVELSVSHDISECYRPWTKDLSDSCKTLPNLCQPWRALQNLTEYCRNLCLHVSW